MICERFAGARRAEWNTLLLEDVLAPCYARLLLDASQLLGFTQHKALSHLWPVWETATEPFDSVVRQLLKFTASLDVLYSPVSGGRWVSPKDAVLVDENTSVSTAGLLADVTSAICDAMLCDGVPLVFVPSQLKDALLKAGITAQQLSPEFVREHYRLPIDQHREYTAAELTSRFPSLSSSNAVINVLYYCMMEVQSGRTLTQTDLIGLPLV